MISMDTMGPMLFAILMMHLFTINACEALSLDHNKNGMDFSGPVVAQGEKTSKLYPR